MSKTDDDAIEEAYSAALGRMYDTLLDGLIALEASNKENCLPLRGMSELKARFSRGAALAREARLLAKELLGESREQV